MSSAAPPPVDPATIPALSGVFTPQADEHDLSDLVVEGELPIDLRGTYVRNGPKVIPRAGSSKDVQWIESDPFWAYHIANAYADGDDIVVDFAKWKEFALGPAPDQTGAATRARIDVPAGKVALDTHADRIVEFPRIDDRLQARQHRHYSVSAKHDLGTGSWNVLLRVDTDTGAVAEWDSGTKVFDEVVFAPAVDGRHEQGYSVTFRTDTETMRSDFVVLAADDIAAGPVATVELPVRVPSGLHGNWFPLGT
jgi:carotenoid cleavage dioxygenase